MGPKRTPQRLNKRDYRSSALMWLFSIAYPPAPHQKSFSHLLIPRPYRLPVHSVEINVLSVATEAIRPSAFHYTRTNLEFRQRKNLPMPRSFIQYGPSALLLSTFIVTVSSQFRQCYDPSGKPSASQPCTPNSVSHCCSPGVDTCLGDTLCLSQYGTLYVGGCTEKSWTGIGCPKYCARYLNGKWSLV